MKTRKCLNFDTKLAFAAAVLILAVFYHAVKPFRDTTREQVSISERITDLIGGLSGQSAAPRSRSCSLHNSGHSMLTLDENSIKVFKKCASKVLQHSHAHDKIWRDIFKNICLHSPGTAHTPDRISDGCHAQRFAWKRDCKREDAGFYISAAEDLASAMLWQSAGCKVVLVLEPPAVMPHSQSLVRQFYKSADIILSSYKIIEDPEKKVFPFVYGSTWIAEEERGIYRKEKNISIIASPKQATEGHKLRHAVIARYATRYGIDVFGRIYNPIDRKIKALADYRYSIIIENSQTEYYITEKLIDAFLTGTIPIYWGAEAARTIFDAEGMLVFKDEHDLNRIVKLATPQYYERKREAILKNYETALAYRCPEERLYYDLVKPLFDAAKEINNQSLQFTT